MKGMEDSLAFAAHESQLFPPSPLEQVPVPLQWRHSTAIKPPKELSPDSYPAESQALSPFYPVSSDQVPTGWVRADQDQAAGAGLGAGSLWHAICTHSQLPAGRLTSKGGTGGIAAPRRLLSSRASSSSGGSTVSGACSPSPIIEKG